MRSRYSVMQAKRDQYDPGLELDSLASGQTCVGWPKLGST